MKVEIKDVFLKELPNGEVINFEQNPIPKDFVEVKAPEKKADDQKKKSPAPK